MTKPYLKKLESMVAHIKPMLLVGVVDSKEVLHLIGYIEAMLEMEGQAR